MTRTGSSGSNRFDGDRVFTVTKEEIEHFTFIGLQLQGSSHTFLENPFAYITRSSSQKWLPPLLELAQATIDNRSSKLSSKKKKTGVKGLVDAGIWKIRPILFHPRDTTPKISIAAVKIPVIYLQSTHRASMVEMIREATANLGIFQVVNHGIPVSVMDEAVPAVCRFYEQDEEVKKGFYTRDLSSTLVYNSNYDLYSSPALNWRDTFFFIYASVTSAA
ncbi:unnamed protein product [Lactuca saligna]|uniref:Non-haem dioxygenase N-terminal domain-containing protein n=1 Tax=Lactuca saligna TaxID=75948 RepID=A0AA36EKC0_LACSI|nr:unnamed protein product [Lactuca saligna]